jgi:carboxymethylenebutenolidase
MPDTNDVAIRFAGGDTLPAALLLPGGDPATAGRRPAVLVLHEMLGVNADIRAIAARLAGHGYVALAPDFLAGLGPRPLCMARFFRGLGRVGTGAPYRRLEAARRWLAARPDVDPHRIAVAGFCVGGGFALLYAATTGAGTIRAVAPFYAGVPADPERALRGACPVIAAYGGRDRVFGPHAARLEAALAGLDIEHRVDVYSDAGHSFMNRHGRLLTAIERRLPVHGGYHAPSAERAWERLFAFLDDQFAAAGG